MEKQQSVHKPIFKEGEVLVLNTDNNTLPFRNIERFVDVQVTRFSPVDNTAGCFNFYLRQLKLVKTGQEIMQVDGDVDRHGRKIDYSKVKLVVIDTLTKLFEHMLVHYKLTNTASGSKDLRNAFGLFQGGVSDLWIGLNSFPIPVVLFSHFDELLDEQGLIDRRAYIPGKAMSGKVEAEFTIVLAAVPDRYEQDISKRFRFQTSMLSGYTCKTPLEMYNNDELYVPNDLNSILYRVYEYYEGKPGEYRIPNILINGASGSGKSTSLRNLVEKAGQKNV